MTERPAWHKRLVGSLNSYRENIKEHGFVGNYRRAHSERAMTRLDAGQEAREKEQEEEEGQRRKVARQAELHKYQLVESRHAREEQQKRVDWAEGQAEAARQNVAHLKLTDAELGNSPTGRQLIREKKALEARQREHKALKAQTMKQNAEKEDQQAAEIRRDAQMNAQKQEAISRLRFQESAIVRDEKATRDRLSALTKRLDTTRWKLEQVENRTGGT